jgi:transposase
VDGVRPAQAPWTEPNSRFTLLFEHWAIAVIEATGVQQRAAKLLRLSPGQVHRIMHRAVNRGLARRDPNAPIRHAWLDEKSIANGHQYATILGNTTLGCVIDVIESRTTDAAKALLKGSLSKTQRKQIECISMDMWRPFASAVKAVVPNADIAHDRFHVAGYLTKAVDDTRKAEHARLAKKATSPLKSSKYLWLMNEDKLADEQKAFLDALARQALETPKVWALKEAFREFFKAAAVEQAEAFFNNWYEAAIQIGNRYLTKVANMLKKHLAGLTAYIKHKATNAVAEAMNANIQLVKARARGYRTFDNFRIAILFFHGKLMLNP